MVRRARAPTAGTKEVALHHYNAPPSRRPPTWLICLSFCHASGIMSITACAMSRPVRTCGAGAGGRSAPQVTVAARQRGQQLHRAARRRMGQQRGRSSAGRTEQAAVSSPAAPARHTEQRSARRKHAAQQADPAVASPAAPARRRTSPSPTGWAAQWAAAAGDEAAVRGSENLQGNGRSVGWGARPGALGARVQPTRTPSAGPRTSRLPAQPAAPTFAYMHTHTYTHPPFAACAPGPGPGSGTS